MNRFATGILGALVCLPALSQAWGQRPDPAQRFRAADRNGDGQLQKTEFAALTQEMPRLQALARGGQLFERLDQDGNGALSVQEMRRLATTIGADRSATPAAPGDRPTDAAAPNNRPGGRGPNFRSAGRGPGLDPRRPRNPGGNNDRPAPLLRMVDRNRDGAVSREEFNQFVERGNAPNKAQFAENAFRRLDVNGDGSLSPQEWSALADLRNQRGNQGRRGGGPRVNPFPDFVRALQSSVSSSAGANAAPAVKSEISPEQAAFFRERIEPVMVGQCYRCHSSDAAQLRGGLRLDTRHGILIGGESGAAVVAGKPDESPLLLALRGDGYSQMPPREPLAPDVVADFERWIRMGGPDPRKDEFLESRVAPQSSIDIEAGRQHWSFQPPIQSKPPAVNDTSWPRSDIDRFVLAKLEENGLSPVGDAQRAALLRRATFDLIGLPPKPEDLASFLADPAPTEEAFASVVDRLLDSPHFGERWGRHWLDVARYAESSGKEINFLYPSAWRYRDYVIDAFNSDKPYDQFLREQLAGDLLSADGEAQRAEHLVATGYLAVGVKSPQERDLKKLVLEIADEQIDAVTRGLLGISVACARCHDHKFEPIPQRDYYALAGVFASSETLYGGVRSPQVRSATELLQLPEDTDPIDPARVTVEQLASWRQQLAEVQDQLRELGRPSGPDPNRLRLIVRAGQLQSRLDRFNEDGGSKPTAMGMREWQASNVPLLVRGEIDKPAEIVPRGFVQVLCATPAPEIQSGSGRLELAAWIASRDNPLTARVMVNRIWSHLFGQGLTPTVDDFGATGEPVSHPELLDYLAVSLMDQQWSVKQLIRQIMLSRTYQLGAADHQANAARDPDNRLLWRHAPRRLEAEAIRDAMLSASGKLQIEPPVGSLIARIGDAPSRVVELLVSDEIGGRMRAAMRPGMNGMTLPGRRGGAATRQAMPRPRGGRGPLRDLDIALSPSGELYPERLHRSVYLPAIRGASDAALHVFDFPDTSFVTGQRDATTVATQSLFLLNSPLVMEQADAMADRLLAAEGDDDARLTLAFQWSFGRSPLPQEMRSSHSFLDDFVRAAPSAYRSFPKTLQRTAWSALCQTLFSTAEFRQID